MAMIWTADSADDVSSIRKFRPADNILARKCCIELHSRNIIATHYSLANSDWVGAGAYTPCWARMHSRRDVQRILSFLDRDRCGTKAGSSKDYRHFRTAPKSATGARLRNSRSLPRRSSK
jgi:hypothetical protein